MPAEVIKMPPKGTLTRERILSKAIGLIFDLNSIFTKHFWDNKQGGFYFTADDGEDLFIRSKEIYEMAAVDFELGPTYGLKIRQMHACCSNNLLLTFQSNGWFIIYYYESDAYRRDSQAVWSEPPDHQVL